MKKFYSGFSINTNIRIPEINIGSNLITPGKAMNEALRKINFDLAKEGKIDPSVRRAYYGQIRLIAEDYLRHNNWRVSEVKNLAKDIQKDHPSVKLQSLENLKTRGRLAINEALKQGYIDNVTSKNETYKTLYVMNLLDQMWRAVNKGVMISNIAIEKEYTSSKWDDAYNKQSILDFGMLVTGDLAGMPNTVRTLSFSTIKKLVLKKSKSSAVGSDPTAFSYDLKSIRKLPKSKQLLADIRSGRLRGYEVIERTRNKHARSLVFINTLYRSFVGQGWSDIKGLADKLSPYELKLAFYEAKKVLDKHGISIDIIFTYHSDDTSDDTKTAHSELFKALENRVNKKIASLQKKKDAIKERK